jgi:nitrogenase molybdenum-iron protein alpha/beta subunit
MYIEKEKDWAHPKGFQTGESKTKYEILYNVWRIQRFLDKMSKELVGVILI